MPYRAGTTVTAVGWGDDGSGTAPAILQQVALQLQSLSACNVAWAGELPSFTTNTMICAGGGGDVWAGCGASALCLPCCAC